MLIGVKMDIKLKLEKKPFMCADVSSYCTSLPFTFIKNYNGKIPYIVFLPYPVGRDTKCLCQSKTAG